MSAVEIGELLEQRFEKYRDDWISKTRHLSNTAQMAMVFSYQHIRDRKWIDSRTFPQKTCSRDFSKNTSNA